MRVAKFHGVECELNDEGVWILHDKSGDDFVPEILNRDTKFMWDLGRIGPSAGDSNAFIFQAMVGFHKGEIVQDDTPPAETYPDVDY